MKCEHCNKYIPSMFLSQMFIDGSYKNVDPECALEIMSEIHGHKFVKFIGTVAQQLLEDFQEWRKTNA